MDPVYDKINLTYEKINNMSIIKLEELITLAFDKYFNTETPIMSDETYDTLVDFLKLKAPKSKVLKNIGAKPVKNKVKLDYWMGSIDKIKLGYDKELDKWMKKYKPPYYISDKLDGVSALLIYRPDSTINLYTRGTATEGQDISHLVKYFDLPKITKPMAFRGEIIINKKKFNDNWSKSLKC
jgi:NAD-dependent DNA ligase